MSKEEQLRRLDIEISKSINKLHGNRLDKLEQEMKVLLQDLSNHLQLLEFATKETEGQQSDIDSLKSQVNFLKMCLEDRNKKVKEDKEGTLYLRKAVHSIVQDLYEKP